MRLFHHAIRTGLIVLLTGLLPVASPAPAQTPPVNQVGAPTQAPTRPGDTQTPNTSNDPQKQADQKTTDQKDEKAAGATDAKGETKGDAKDTGKKEVGKPASTEGTAVRQQDAVQRVTKSGSTARRRTGGAAKKIPPPQFQYPEDAVLACLRFSPPDVYAGKGEELELDVVLANRSNRTVDALNFTVLYDPRRASMVDCDLSPLRSFLSEGMEGVTVERTSGTVQVIAALTRPLGLDEAVLARLRFHVAGVAGVSAFRFLRPPKGVSAVFNRGENILGDPGQGLSGLIDANLFVLPDETARPVVLDSDTLTSGGGKIAEFLDKATPRDTETSRTVETRGWLNAPPAARREAMASLILQGPAAPDVKVGEDFWVDLVLMNDALASVDSLGVTVAFDPDVLEVIDEDEDNWIFRGVNIWDGAFREAYPFDFHRANDADNENGRIRYEVGRNAEAWDFPTGVFARIHFRAKAAAKRTVVSIVRENGPGPDRRTWLRAFGIDRLDQAWAGKRPPSVVLHVTAP